VTGAPAAGKSTIAAAVWFVAVKKVVSPSSGHTAHTHD
jgi:adenylylsulfate kinase-like enzyme